MTSDPRELVDRLDALAQKYAARLLRDDYLHFAVELVAAYPTLRAAVLRVAEMRDALRRLHVVAVAQQKLLVCYRLNRRPAESTLDALYDTDGALSAAAAALTAPQGEEQA